MLDALLPPVCNKRSRNGSEISLVIQLVPNNQCAPLMRNAPKQSDNDLIHPGCLDAWEKSSAQLKGFHITLIILGIVPAHLKV